jgi:hypothetical protein
VGGIEISAIEYSHCVIAADWQSFEELDKALLVVDLWFPINRLPS